jgi:hypothetical protein
MGKFPLIAILDAMASGRTVVRRTPSRDVASMLDFGERRTSQWTQ